MAALAGSRLNVIDAKPHALFTCDTQQAVQAIAFNGWVTYEPRRAPPCLVSGSTASHAASRPGQPHNILFIRFRVWFRRIFRKTVIPVDDPEKRDDAAALQRRFPWLPDRGGHRGAHPVCGSDLHGMDWRRHVADLDLADRGRLDHLHRRDGGA